jgi:transposase
MTLPISSPKRFIGLDIHKYYLVATGVDADLTPIYGPRRIEYTCLEQWMHKDLTPLDAVVVEMTTNTWQIYDELLPRVHSITVVHPPHISLITRAQVMNDKIAALTLARLHAKGLLVGIWVPPKEVRDLRALIAQRSKMTRLSTQAKNRLQAILHRHHIPPPPGNLYHPALRSWWEALPLSLAEKTTLTCDLDTLVFAQTQISQIEAALSALAAQDDRIPLLIQLPGISLVTALTLLAAIGPIQRFPSASQLVGYAGLGTRIHDSGLSSRSGRITKAGRKDIRAAMVEAAQTASNTHPHWSAELERLQPRTGRNKAIVAIARKLLVTVWNVLTKQVADRFADPELVARKLFQHAYKLGSQNRPKDQSTAAFVRQQLDRLGLGADLDAVRWGIKKAPIKLPPSALRLSPALQALDSG